jgi:hypothetical protein
VCIRVAFMRAYQSVQLYHFPFSCHIVSLAAVPRSRFLCFGQKISVLTGHSELEIPARPTLNEPYLYYTEVGIFLPHEMLYLFKMIRPMLHWCEVNRNVFWRWWVTIDVTIILSIVHRLGFFKHDVSETELLPSSSSNSVSRPTLFWGFSGVVTFFPCYLMAGISTFRNVVFQ